MVDIVIVNWNSGYFLKNCIDSIFKNENSQFVNTVYVVDNNSSDSSLADISMNQNIELIQNDYNAGFSKACNQGFKKSTAQFVLLLNPDTRLAENTLKECIEGMDAKADIDILGCCLLDDLEMRTHSCSRLPTPCRVFFDASGLSKIAPRLFTPSTIMTDWDHNTSRQVEQVMGAFMFMKKSIFERLGYFDERFFVYYEEVDFSKRLAIIKGKIFYNAAIKAFHSGEGTTKSVKAFRLFLSLKSRLQYARKYFTLPGIAVVWLSTFFIEPVARTVFFLFKGQAKEIKELVKGYILLIKNSPLR